VIRALLFIVIVGALALIILSLLRRSPKNVAPPPRAAAADDDTSEQRALPAPGDYVERSLSRATTMHLFHELVFAAPLEASVPAEQMKVAMAVANTLQAVAGDPKYAPRRPLLLPELVRAVNDSDTTRRELAQMIARDPALVGSLLKLANSPIYRRGSQPVESLERALAVLGTMGTRSLVAAAWPPQRRMSAWGRRRRLGRRRQGACSARSRRRYSASSAIAGGFTTGVGAPPIRALRQPPQR
jgi:hypothetical protein